MALSNMGHAALMMYFYISGKSRQSKQPNVEQARRIGELIEAQRVIWGSYQHQDDKWQVTVYLLNVATGQMFDPLTTASTDWYDIRDTMTEHILEQFKIKPSEEEQKKLRRRETTSPTSEASPPTHCFAAV